MKTNRSTLNPLLVFGLAAIAFANVAAFLLQRHTSYPESLTDPISGFLQGVAITTTLLGIWQQTRTMRGKGNDPCARTRP
jgi:hypothetical protein